MSARPVFARFDETKACLIRIWAASWSAQGWLPGILSPKEIAEARGSARVARDRRAREAPLVDLLVINFGYPHYSKRRPRVVKFGFRGWKEALLVKFPAGATEEQVLGCGRELCH